MSPNGTEQRPVSPPAGQEQQVTHMNPRIENDRQSIVAARQKGTGALVKTFLRLSGPGWLQSGITVGGVSFSSSLYLGVLVGFSMMWLQPLAMILGIIMLGAIAYVTLSIRERPLLAINKHVSPVLGWSWLFASMAANLVWSMPQYVLGTRAIQQNLFPNVLGPEAIPNPWGRIISVGFILAICITATMFYGAGGRGVKIFEIIIKSIVSMIVLSFMGVVIKLSLEGVIDWGQILSGLIPRFRMLWEPAATIKPHIEAVAPQFQQFWTQLIIGQQRDVMIAATAAAVGINMTFLLPYSMLRKGWDKDFRGLAIFDLSTGLFIPFILATGFVIIASASRFHTTPAPGFVPDEPGGTITSEAPKNLIGPWNNLMANRLKAEVGQAEFERLMGDVLELPDTTQEEVEEKEKKRMERFQSVMSYADKNVGAMLVKRDNLNLAAALEPLTGSFLAQFVFGLGVLGMGISAATMLMTINGLCLCELLNRPLKGWTQRIGSLIVAVGALSAIFWNSPAPWIAMPTSVFCIILLPIAYFAFLLLMNQKSMLGEHMPQGGKRLVWNVLMVIATVVATLVSIWSLWSRLGGWSIAVVVAFVGLILVVHFIRKSKGQAAAA